MSLIASHGWGFCFEEAGREFNISPLLLESIARTESNLNPKAVNQNSNGSKDFGLMQINSYWVRTLAMPVDKLMNDACYNTRVGAKVLRGCIDSNGYNWNAVGCYNASTKSKRAKYAWKVFKNLEKCGKTVAKVSPAPVAAVPTPHPQQESTRELSVAISDIQNSDTVKPKQAPPELNPRPLTFDN